MRLIVVLAVQVLLFACTSADGEKQLNNQLSDSLASPTIVDVDPSVELTLEQSTAFDALNSIQVQAGGTLYSTFVGSIFPCSPPDTTFVLSRAELKSTLQGLLGKYCTNIPVEQRTKLIAEAVLAQEEYLVEQCYGTVLKPVDGVIKSVPTPGSWILRRVLGRRDVILEW